jgi:type I restriction enzyme S subunit
MSEWKEILLTDITTKIGDGLHGTPIYDSKGEYYFINGNNLANGKILIKKETQKVSKAEFQKYAKPLNERTLLLGINGTIGNLAYYRNEKCVLGKSACYINLNDEVDTRFIYYTFLSKHFQNYIEGIATGTTIPNVPLKGIREYAFKLPPLPEQKSIAETLSSLDDKIDLLHRQNKTLEQLAETLFRQWFVEEAEESWEEVDLEFVTTRITDGSHSSPSTTETGLPMASVKDMHDWGIDLNTCRKISENDFNELVRNDCKPLKNDIVIAKDGSYLKHIFLCPQDLELVILSSIALIRPNGKYNAMLLTTFLKMASTIKQLENIVTGGVIPRIVLKDFRKFKIKLPPIKIQNEAIKDIEPLYLKCWNNTNQIHILTQLRDTLLPKLMSGEVRVGN